jgi:hypothetical protein
MNFSKIGGPARKNNWMRLSSLLLSALLLANAGIAFAQDSAQQQPASAPAPVANTTQSDAPKAPEVLPVPTDPRQAALFAKTQKLLKLAQELKEEVAKSDKDTLSLAVVKKAAEIEKLAKSLKEEMNKNP